MIGDRHMYRIHDIGTVYIGIEETKQGIPESRLLGFTLPADTQVPNEFKEGDEVEIVNFPAHPAVIQMGNNPGYYEIKHLASGKILRTFHRDDEWKVPTKPPL
jgi:hypothetical protein